MAAQIVNLRDLHLEVGEGLIAHLTRAALSLVGRYTVSELVLRKEAGDNHPASHKTLLAKFGPQLPNLPNERKP